MTGGQIASLNSRLILLLPRRAAPVFRRRMLFDAENTRASAALLLIAFLILGGTLCLWIGPPSQSAPPDGTRSHSRKISHDIS